MIRWEVRDRVGIATIDRPERRNALNADLCVELLGHLEATRDLRAVVITGAGDKAFCSGADLAAHTADTAEPGGADTFRPAFDRLLRPPRAAGGGALQGARDRGRHAARGGVRPARRRVQRHVPPPRRSPRRLPEPAQRAAPRRARGPGGGP